MQKHRNIIFDSATTTKNALFAKNNNNAFEAAKTIYISNYVRCLSNFPHTLDCLNSRLLLCTISSYEAAQKKSIHTKPTKQAIDLGKLVREHGTCIAFLVNIKYKFGIVSVSHTQNLSLCRYSRKVGHQLGVCVKYNGLYKPCYIGIDLNFMCHSAMPYVQAPRPTYTWANVSMKCLCELRFCDGRHLPHIVCVMFSFFLPSSCHSVTPFDPLLTSIHSKYGML